MPERTDNERLDVLEKDHLTVWYWPNHGGFWLSRDGYIQPGFYPSIREAIDAYIDAMECRSTKY